MDFKNHKYAKCYKKNYIYQVDKLLDIKGY